MSTSGTGLSPVQVRALEIIQNRQMTAKPGSRDAREDGVLEQAKDYVLNRGHATNVAFLVHDAVRDGRKAVRRRARSEFAAMREIAALTSPSGTNDPPGSIRINRWFRNLEQEFPRSATTRRGGGGGSAGATRIVSPDGAEGSAETSLVDSDLRAHVEIVIGARGVAVLETMVEGLTIKESALRLGLGTTTIESYRARIKAVATDVLDEAA